jgi:F0F1-type ATP synthase membrane subunit a
MVNRYDKMEDYIISVFYVFNLVNKKAEQQNDKRMKMIALIIYNYIRYMAKDNGIELKITNEQESINLIPIFEYVAANNVELYDFKNINMNDVDVNKKEDLERYVLTHIYYITQGK